MDTNCSCESCQRRWHVFQAMIQGWKLGQITVEELDEALVLWEIYGEMPYVTIDGVHHRLTDASVLCPCERAFLCPLTETTKARSC